jgi:alpha-1,3-rhamnosyltransferase
VPAPTVSVLVTSYNLEGLIHEALDSVVEQTFQDLELIIVDDASPDSTADRIQAWLDDTRFPARFIRNRERRGLCANLNRELEIARGRFVCLLDHDDVYEADCIERQLAHLRSQPDDVAAVFSDATMVDADGRLVHSSFLRYHLGDEAVPVGPEIFRRLLLRGNFLPASAVMVRRHAVDVVGRFDESLFYQDYDLWLKLSHQFGFDYLEGHVLKYRLMADSMSRSSQSARPMLDSESRILRSWLGHCGTLQNALVDRLMNLGARQLDRAFFEDAMQTFEAVGAYSTGLRRAAIGCLEFPGVPAAISTLRRSYQFGRRGVTGLTRLAKRLSSS